MILTYHDLIQQEIQRLEEFKNEEYEKEKYFDADTIDACIHLFRKLMEDVMKVHSSSLLFNNMNMWEETQISIENVMNQMGYELSMTRSDFDQYQWVFEKRISYLH